MIEFNCKAIIYKGPEEVYGPCGCGMDLALLPVLLPRSWLMEENPAKAEEHDFCRGFDFRRISGMSCSQVLEHDGFLANFSCCRDCATRAVEYGYAVWADKDYPMTL